MADYGELQVETVFADNASFKDPVHKRALPAWESRPRSVLHEETVITESNPAVTNSAFETGIVLIDGVTDSSVPYSFLLVRNRSTTTPVIGRCYTSVLPVQKFTGRLTYSNNTGPSGNNIIDADSTGSLFPAAGGAAEGNYFLLTKTTSGNVLNPRMIASRVSDNQLRTGSDNGDRFLQAFGTFSGEEWLLVKPAFFTVLAGGTTVIPNVCPAANLRLYYPVTHSAECEIIGFA